MSMVFLEIESDVLPSPFGGVLPSTDGLQISANLSLNLGNSPNVSTWDILKFVNIDIYKLSPKGYLHLMGMGKLPHKF
jgi:hypothetical protein